jgi:hypothetical protein
LKKKQKEREYRPRERGREENEGEAEEVRARGLDFECPQGQVLHLIDVIVFDFDLDQYRNIYSVY